MTTSTLTRPNSSYAIPPTQNTAPIYEHSCLYTYDIRRKNAKRWQDGFLRYHTFNKRCMLYDVPRNFIGDTHWQESEAVTDGDEIVLEKAGVLVQVCEKTGTIEADLSGLWEHRKEREKRCATDTSKSSIDTSSSIMKQGTLVPRNPNIPPRTPRTPRPVTSRAVAPQTSPYEQRQATLAVPTVRPQEQSYAEERPSKRPRNDENHIPLWQILRTSKPAKTKETRTNPSIQARPISNARIGPGNCPVADKTRPSLANKKKQGKLKVTEHVDLTGVSSQENVGDAEVPQQQAPPTDNSRPSKTAGWFSPPREALRSNPPTTRASRPLREVDRVEEDRHPPPQSHVCHISSEVRKDGPEKRCNSEPRPPTANVHPRLQQISLPNPSTPTLRHLPQPLPQSRLRPQLPPRHQPQPPSSPPVSTKNHLPSLHEGQDDSSDVDAARRAALPTQSRQNNSAASRETKALRVVSRPLRKTLLCQKDLNIDASDANDSDLFDKKRPRELNKGHEPAQSRDSSSARENTTGEEDVIMSDLIPALNTASDNGGSIVEKRDSLNPICSGRVPDQGHVKNLEKPTTSVAPQTHLNAEIPGVSLTRRTELKPNKSLPEDRARGANMVVTKRALNGLNDDVTQRAGLSKRSPLKRAETIAGEHDVLAGGLQQINGNLGRPTNSDDLSKRPVPKPIAKQSLQRAATIAGFDNLRKGRERGIDQVYQKEARHQTNAVYQSADERAITGNIQQPVAQGDERGPWTREAFDLFGMDIPRRRQEKSGRPIEWLDKYTSNDATHGIDDVTAGVAIAA